MAYIVGTKKRDILAGTLAADAMFGLDGNDDLYGGDGNDVLRGGDGFDKLYGGAGNDALYGDAGNDAIAGQTGNDTLDGGVGNDTMNGGSGNDVYIVDSTGDLVIESVNFGNDGVRSSVNYTLGLNVENLLLTGSANISGTGNAAANNITGNTGANVIQGAGGNDNINGGGGTDTAVYSGSWRDYAISSAGAVVTLADTRGGSPDGTDSVTNVELFRFANGTFTLAQILNDTPVANADSGFSTNEDTVLVLTPSQLLGNDTDADTALGDTLTLQSVQGAVNGTVAIVSGNVKFTPAADCNGPASFTYTVVDAKGATSTATVSLTVNAVNDAAVIAGDTTGSIDEDGVPNTASGNLDHTDVDNTDDVFQAVTTPAATVNGYGTYTVTADGQWTYTLDNGNAAVNALDDTDTLTDTFTVLAEDGTAQTVTVTITGTTDPAPVIDLTTLTSAQGFIIQGDGAGDQAGQSVSNVGDVNGDGFDDLIVGAHVGDDGGTDAGEAYVVFGSSSGFGTPDGSGRQVIDLTNLAAAQGFIIQGDTNGDNAGWSVSSAGDVNGDGFDDLIVGARWGDDGGTDAGEAYVVFGSGSGFGSPDGSGRQVIDLTPLTAAQGFIIQGDTSAGKAGASVSGVGDVNGDGFDDLVVGAPYAYDGGFEEGEAYVVFGSGSGFGTPDGGGRQVIDLTTLAATQGFVIQGDSIVDHAGWSVSGAGDVNGDGFDDIVVGAIWGDDGGGDAGEAYVVFGSGSGFGTNVGGRQVIDLTTLTATQGFIVQGDTDSDYAGWSVSSAGDVNGDGFDDLIVGAPAGGDGGSFAGETYVVFGSGSGFGTPDGSGRQVIDLTILTAAQGFIIQGDTYTDRSGWSVSGAGDVNGDGFDDIVVGAIWGDDGGTDAGEAYVVFGSGSGFGTPDGSNRQVIDLTSLTAAQGFIIQGDVGGDQAGYSVSRAGDINGDGFDDLVIGANIGDDGGVDAGEAYVIFGADFGASGTPITLSGGTGAEMLIGGLGNDTLSGGGGADVIRSGAGDDRITVGDTSFFRIDGGTGQDRLAVAGAAFNLDLTVIDNLAIKGIETIDLTGGGVSTLALNVDDLLDLAGSPNAALASSGFTGPLSHNSLLVMGDASDNLTLVNPGTGEVGDGGSWASAGSVTIGSDTYTVYNYTNASGLIASLAVDNDFVIV